MVVKPLLGFKRGEKGRIISDDYYSISPACQLSPAGLQYGITTQSVPDVHGKSTTKELHFLYVLCTRSQNDPVIDEYSYVHI